jgi:MFS family permease
MKSLNRNLLLLFAAGVVGVISIQLIQPLFPLFLESQGASELEVSLVISMASLATTALMIPVGFLMERVGKKRMIIIGFLIWAASSAFLGPVRDWRIAAPLYMVYNLAEAFVGPARMAMISDFSTPVNKATVFGMMSMDWAIGGIFSPPLSGYLAERAGWQLPFQVATVVMVLALVPILFLEEGARGGKKEKRGGASAIFRGEHLAVISLFFLFAFVLSAGQSVVSTMLPIFLKNQMGLTLPSIGQFFAGASIMSMLGQIPGGWLADRYGRKKIIVGFLLPIPFLFGSWAAAHDRWGLLALYSLFSGCLSMTGAASLALLSESFPAELEGEAFSVRMTGFRMGSIAGPLIGGYLYSSLNPRSPFTAAAILFSIGILVIYLIKEKSLTTRAQS